ncbi:hypothetical protein [Maricaulis salignorans]|uniref:Uncharacterized protein n=1 Tax=Maricaulis salignorans TaxID=144026 RepID=A0A1G9P1C0_9PROT|nr:hypothetical protein [Maricaulis salignorans]SDL92343.1 hypothetical protein SAMN04488568_10364 [Maricaulis salignorans]
MPDFQDSLHAMRKAALIRAANEYEMRYSADDIDEALAKNRTLNQGLRRLLAKQSADILLGYSLRRFSSIVYRQVLRGFSKIPSGE